MDDKKYPVCFTRNTKMDVTGKFIFEPADIFNNVQVKIKGDGPGNLDIPETVAKINNNELTVTNIDCANPFVDEVDIFDPMEIKWQILAKGREIDAGTTKNQVYVTLGDPQTTVFHTLAHLGCKNADGETEGNKVVDKMFEDFRDRSILRVNTTSSMTYWSTYNSATEPDCWSTEGLLKYGDGRCGAWAEFFRDMVKVQGISNVIKICVEPHMISDVEKLQNAINNYLGKGQYEFIPIFYVKNWNLTNSNPFNPIDQLGVAGQGNNDPKSDFTNHAILQFDNKYYDPSYGTGPFNSKTDWEDASLDGFGAYVIRDGINMYLYEDKIDSKGIAETTFTVTN